jgi:hypothetical protein
MLYFALKLGTGAQFHVIVGKPNCEFEAHRMMHLPGR